MRIVQTSSLKILVVLLLILTSCSAIYEPVPGNEVYSGTFQMIKLSKLSVKAYLAVNGKDPGSFYVTLMLSKIPEGRNLQLSGLKLELINSNTGDKAVPQQTVQLGYAADTSKVWHRETLDRYALESEKKMELKGWVSYDFNYRFTGADHKHHSPKMQVKFQFNIQGDDKIETIVKTIDFKRKTYLNVSGN